MFEDTKVGLGQLPDSHIVGQVGDTGEGSGNHLHIQVGIGSVNNVGDPARYFSYSY
ncbi:hypothetical protein SDC9_206246 [bioreactor metagenome]|uniref:Peptidase M23 domain-containing protein n=1 Tax=bioreactor metagenome TaxID=1076179 RepID=A0A645J5X8_9ZZZZ